MEIGLRKLAQKGLVSRTPEVTLDSRGMSLNRLQNGLGAQLHVSDAFSRINHMQNCNLKQECYPVWLLILVDDTRYICNCYLC